MSFVDRQIGNGLVKTWLVICVAFHTSIYLSLFLLFIRKPSVFQKLLFFTNRRVSFFGVVGLEIKQKKNHGRAQLGAKNSVQSTGVRFTRLPIMQPMAFVYQFLRKKPLQQIKRNRHDDTIVNGMTTGYTIRSHPSERNSIFIRHRNALSLASNRVGKIKGKSEVLPRMTAPTKRLIVTVVNVVNRYISNEKIKKNVLNVYMKPNSKTKRGKKKK